MWMRRVLSGLAAVALGGCGNDGVEVKHLGPEAAVCCLVSAPANGLVAYLANPATRAGNVAVGQLHVADAQGGDRAIADGVPGDGYLIAPDGKSLFFTKPVGNQAALWRADLTNGAIAEIFATGLPLTNLAAEAFFSPRGTYLLVGVRPPNVARSVDLHVIDTHTGADVYQRPDGGFNYLELVYGDDTMVFQDTAGGTDVARPPVQTLYWVSLPSATTQPPVAITTRTAEMVPAAEDLLILRTNGELLRWSVRTRELQPAPLATDAVRVVTNGAGDLAAVIGRGGALRVLPIAGGGALLDLPDAKADPVGAVEVTADGLDVYFYRNVSTQSRRGTLMRVPLAAGAMPTMVAEDVALVDLLTPPRELLGLEQVDELGLFGVGFRGARDGAGRATTGSKILLGSTQVARTSDGAWYAAQLLEATLHPSATLKSGGIPISGRLRLSGSAATLDQILDERVHLGGFTLSGDGEHVAFAGEVAFSTARGAFVGSLAIAPTRTPTVRRRSGLEGVSELGPIVGNALFVLAPAAERPGLYLVRF